MRQVLVLCTANRCRSPLVATYLQEKVRNEGLADQIEVTSGGLFAEAGIPADPEIVTLLTEAGLDGSAHVSRPVDAAALRRADLILVMEEAHRQAIFHRTPGVLARVWLLAELVQDHHDIEDAHGREFAAYQALNTQVQEIIAAGWPRLRKRLGV